MSLLSRSLSFLPRLSFIRTLSSIPEPFDELIQAVNQTHDSQLPPQYSESNLRAWDPERLKPFALNRAVQPSSFSMNGRFKRQIFFKRPYLGPSAPESRRKDVFHQLGIDPLHESFNSNLLSFYVTDMGRVSGRAETGLTWRSQRRLTRAIRRAKMMGIMPLHSKRHLLKGY